MTDHAFTLGDALLHARPSGALWWPALRLLAVGDLHLGRAQRGALWGGAALPPYEARETLDRLAAEVEALRPAVVVSLGDGFDDAAAAARLEDEALARLSTLAAGRDWVWIAGNHDPGPAALPGAWVAELRPSPGGPVFRHIAEADEDDPEVSAHWHPKARIGGARRRCFLLDGRRLVLPAFGAFTGGLDVGSEPLTALMPEGLALLCGDAVRPAPLSGLRARRPGRRHAR
ncbi:ligase-associated DNA damage response endonuclease PdeM [Rhodovulum sp. DZ06]|uniref:ligase-associated DNA damage response endonuclease PdeM n=1 Tax=Rhodovulum sp. DZ06 TaxID=3425126 RepID=UPI003D33E8A8